MSSRIDSDGPMLSRLRRLVRRQGGLALRGAVNGLLDRTGWLALGKTVTSNVPAYYTPIPDDDDLPPEFWDREVSMVGVTIDDDVVRRFVEELVVPHLEEFRSLYPAWKENDEDTGFFLFNGSYMAVDAHVLHGIVRSIRPRRVIEIGSGASTRIIESALRLNQAGRCSSIDPFPSPWLQGIDPSIVELMTTKVQSVPLSFFDELDKDDILFIDSSHVVREGNDVLFEYMEILPRLRPGVLVHIHDVSLPRRYPKFYFDAQLFWTEQYLLKAYLTHNSRVEIVWPGNYTIMRHREYVVSTFPEMLAMRRAFPSSEPTAFWYRVR
ncbi:MAG: class I SAM-dependent methyltransferase [Deltaproteobacteria bacterium]|nr:class I SAM-dependent methyltransferase [Deltaproteobacteria bacterium]